MLKFDPKCFQVKDEVPETDNEAGMDRDVLINHRYENAMATAVQFLSVFLKKCGSKSEETDFRPLFENFLQDLLVTVNTPEWPAAELLLSLLGKLLVSQFASKGTFFPDFAENFLSAWDPDPQIYPDPRGKISTKFC